MKRKLIVALLVVSTGIMLGGCQAISNLKSDFTQQTIGLPMTVQTYDYDAQKIDTVHGKSLSIKRDAEFDQTDTEGKTIKKSSVLDLTLGGKQITHVGSSLVAYQDGLTNVLDKYPKRENVTNGDSSIPFMNRFVNRCQNAFTGASKVILIRTQTGKPIATFAGKTVSYKATRVPSSTSLLINGKRLFIYRCDFTIYTMDSLGV
ncbi:DUF5052 family protein [Levilactobacillus acidifarinae]|uniref:DUF5052 domain-containing protein n=1 Tax=Levilactobacillus acidifarinae DSM 19394 = JCM 15949 TaxID=1423715 RepID=A0A0R1LS66_9LACO|nr:DUF5052 family protein [Levilactobacillus acidifarinae]KRK94231.1 hypothetical protein FD25_GL000182 [Levilactobacillus acidifarinae DSM 19394]GEO70517.1 lipoprotein [Levilactobacillus acidifarinae]